MFTNVNCRYSKDSIIRPGLIIFRPFEIGLSTVLIIESFDNFLNSTYIRDSTYNFHNPKVGLVQYLSNFLRPFQPFSYIAFSLNII